MLALRPYKGLSERVQEISVLGARLHSTITNLTVSEILGGSFSKYRLEYFSAHEFLCPEHYCRWGDDGLMFVDVRMQWTADAVREHFGKPAYINTYNLPQSVQKKIRAGSTDPIGYRRDSGLRLFDYDGLDYLTIHKFGGAIDIIVNEVSAEEVRQEIQQHPKEPAFRFITRVENGRKTYNHFDCAFTNKDTIHFFKP
jgi:hypothetical protein